MSGFQLHVLFYGLLALVPVEQVGDDGESYFARVAVLGQPGQGGDCSDHHPFLSVVAASCTSTRGERCVPETVPDPIPGHTYLFDQLDVDSVRMFAVDAEGRKMDLSRGSVSPQPSSGCAGRVPCGNSSGGPSGRGEMAQACWIFPMWELLGRPNLREGGGGARMGFGGGRLRSCSFVLDSVADGISRTRRFRFENPGRGGCPSHWNQVLSELAVWSLDLPQYSSLLLKFSGGSYGDLEVELEPRDCVEGEGSCVYLVVGNPFSESRDCRSPRRRAPHLRSISSVFEGGELPDEAVPFVPWLGWRQFSVDDNYFCEDVLEYDAVPFLEVIRKPSVSTVAACPIVQ